MVYGVLWCIHRASEREHNLKIFKCADLCWMIAVAYFLTWCRRDMKTLTCAYFYLLCSVLCLLSIGKEVGLWERLSLHNFESRRLLIIFLRESSLLRVSEGSWPKKVQGRSKKVQEGPEKVQGGQGRSRRVTRVDFSERRYGYNHDPGVILK